MSAFFVRWYYSTLFIPVARMRSSFLLWKYRFWHDFLFTWKLDEEKDLAFVICQRLAIVKYKEHTIFRWVDASKWRDADLWVVKAPEYTFRSLGCNIRPDNELWCVSGQMIEDGHALGGVLEWCYDEQDAYYIKGLMEGDPRFVWLEASQ